MIELVVIGGILYFKSKDGSNTKASFDDLFRKYSAQFGLDFYVVKAVCMKESTLGTHPRVLAGLRNPADIEGSKSEDGKSWGLMQITIPTARDMDPTATAEKLNNPEYSVRLACQYLAWLYLRFSATDPRRTEWVIKSYNQGLGNTQKEMRGEIKGYATDYFKKFLEFYKMAKEGAI